MDCVLNRRERQADMITYITTATNIHYTLTRKELIKLLQQFAKELTKKYPTSWDVNG